MKSTLACLGLVLISVLGLANASALDKCLADSDCASGQRCVNNICRGEADEKASSDSPDKTDEDERGDRANRASSSSRSEAPSSPAASEPTDTRAFNKKKASEAAGVSMGLISGASLLGSLIAGASTENIGPALSIFGASLANGLLVSSVYGLQVGHEWGAGMGGILVTLSVVGPILVGIGMSSAAN